MSAPVYSIFFFIISLLLLSLCSRLSASSMWCNCVEICSASKHNIDTSFSLLTAAAALLCSVFIAFDRWPIYVFLFDSFDIHCCGVVSGLQGYG